MSNVKEFPLKVMINKENTQVLFGEADSNFTDVLLSFLTLPLGTIVRLMQKHYGDQAPPFGSLSNLRNSLANLDNSHFWTEGGKLMLLNPRNSLEAECRKLRLNLDDTEPTKYFTCEVWNCGGSKGYPRRSNISMCYDTSKCRCGGKMNREIKITKSETENKDADDNGGFAIKAASFLIGDDLKMVPNVAGSIFQTLGKLGVIDTNGAEQRTVTVGFNEIMDLLKGSLLSDTMLTDLILGQRKMNSTTIKFEPAHHIEKEETSDSKKMILKVKVQKSKNKFLFAQAEYDFVDFLFSFLTIPLAGVEWLLGGNTSLRNIDNLYNSSANLIKYLKTESAENSLFQPKLPCMYLSGNQLFPLKHTISKLFYNQDHSVKTESLSNKKIYGSQLVVIRDPKGKGTYVKGSGMYMISNDLTVTPLLMSSSLSILKGMNIQLSDVEEMEIHVGLEEVMILMIYDRKFVHLQ